MEAGAICRNACPENTAVSRTSWTVCSRCLAPKFRGAFSSTESKPLRIRANAGLSPKQLNGAFGRAAVAHSRLCWPSGAEPGVSRMTRMEWAIGGLMTLLALTMQWADLFRWWAPVCDPPAISRRTTVQCLDTLTVTTDATTCWSYGWYLVRDDARSGGL